MKFKANLKELEAKKKRNEAERLKFAKDYAEWVKKTPNKVWSSAQKKVVNQKK